MTVSVKVQRWEIKSALSLAETWLYPSQVSSSSAQLSPAQPGSWLPPLLPLLRTGFLCTFLLAVLLLDQTEGCTAESWELYNGSFTCCEVWLSRWQSQACLSVTPRSGPVMINIVWAGCEQYVKNRDWLGLQQVLFWPETAQILWMRNIFWPWPRLNILNCAWLGLWVSVTGLILLVLWDLDMAQMNQDGLDMSYGTCSMS